MNKINGNTRFTAVQIGDAGEVYLVFYERKEDVGSIERAAGLIEFSNWEKYREFTVLQSVLFARFDRNQKEKSRVAASGN